MRLSSFNYLEKNYDDSVTVFEIRRLFYFDFKSKSTLTKSSNILKLDLPKFYIGHNKRHPQESKIIQIFNKTHKLIFTSKLAKWTNSIKFPRFIEHMSSNKIIPRLRSMKKKKKKKCIDKMQNYQRQREINLKFRAPCPIVHNKLP